ncbi:MAG: hypothetical protein U5K00_00535 [Melioribacteraceae bacterium]|nr:hypothetical protein [Melioribacteraceae bacterium]
MYSPKIKPELVQALYRLKQTVRKPMTTLVNEAVYEYLHRRNEEDDKKERNNQNNTRCS